MSIITSLSRTARIAGATVVLVISSADALLAQHDAPRTATWEARVASGAFVGVGDQRQSLKDAQVTSLQISRLVQPQIAVTGTFAWARSRDLASIGAPKLDVFGSDIGLEARSAERGVNRAVSIRAFAGFGGGARSYNHRSLDIAATHNLAAYASVGGEVGLGRVALRVEARDYTTGFRPLSGAGSSVARNDVYLMGALRLNRHRVAQSSK